MAQGTTAEILYCSFCGKSQHKVAKLIVGNTANICDICAPLCVEISLERGGLAKCIAHLEQEGALKAKELGLQLLDGDSKYAELAEAELKVNLLTAMIADIGQIIPADPSSQRQVDAAAHKLARAKTMQLQVAIAARDQLRSEFAAKPATT